VAGHVNEDLPNDPAILDPAGAGSLADPSDQQILAAGALAGCRWLVLAPRAGGL
jgi:hypothetical protein